MSASILDTFAQARTPLKVGVVLPRSSLYPAMAGNFLAGMRLYISQALGPAGERAISLLTEEFGASPARALQQTRSLIEDHQVDLVVSTINLAGKVVLQRLLEERQTPFIVSSVGANIARVDHQSPYIFKNTLNFWESAWALGNWAAGNIGKRGFVATSFHDSGYDANYAFQLGVESAGGTIVQTQITQHPTATDGLAPLVATIARSRPDFVYASYYGQQAVEFVRAYARAGLARQIPLLGSSFLVDESILPQQGSAALGIRTVLPWAPSLATPENRAFSAAYQTYAGRPADAFAVLGYDTARLIDEAQRALDGRAPSSERLREALGGAAFASPRGPLAMNPAASQIGGPLYLREVGGGTRLGNLVVGKLDTSFALDDRVAALRKETKTGWVNAYLCV